MKINVKAVKTLFKAKRVTIDSVKKLVEGNFITEAQFAEITGTTYAQ